MLPDPSHPCWRLIVTGKQAVQTQMLGLQMILKRIQRHVKPGCPDSDIQAAADELRAFFLKYQGSLADEIKAL